MLSMSFVAKDLQMFNAEMAMFVEGTLLAQGYAVSQAFSLELVPSVRSKILDFEEIISKVSLDLQKISLPNIAFWDNFKLHAVSDYKKR